MKSQVQKVPARSTSVRIRTGLAAKSVSGAGTRFGFCHQSEVGSFFFQFLVIHALDTKFNADNDRLLFIYAVSMPSKKGTDTTISSFFTSHVKTGDSLTSR
jgi:hypothetical protein